MRLSEQQLVNAICEHMAERKQVPPSEVTVDLMWDEDLGYGAEVTVQGRTQVLVEANIAEAVMRYVHRHFGLRVFRDQIRLDIEDEMVADIAV